MSEERPETCKNCGAPVVWCTCDDPFPTVEEANAILRAAGRDPADVGKIGELFAKNCMLQVELKETIARAERAEAERDALREANRWIPVSEKDPEPETVVIVYDRKTDKVYEGYMSSEVGDWCENTWCLRRLWSVTHWMPKTLPEPPQDGAQ